MKARLVSESLIDKQQFEEEPGEMEGASYKAKLEEMVELAMNAYQRFPDGDVPAWVQDKIVEAKQHLQDIDGWMRGVEEGKGGKEEGEGEGPMGAFGGEEEEMEEEPEMITGAPEEEEDAEGLMDSY